MDGTWPVTRFFVALPSVRQWQPLTTLDRYLLRKTLIPLAATVGVALLALLLERLIRLLDMVVTKGGPLQIIVKMLVNLVPHYLGLALPVAFFLAVLLAVMRLSNDNELDAMRAFGASLRRLLVPQMGLAILLSITVLIITGFLQPHTRYAYRALVYAVKHASWASALQKGAFFSGFENRTILVQDIRDRGQVLLGVFVHEELADGETVTTTAERGRVSRSSDGIGIVLELDRGVQIRSDAPSGNTTAISFESMNLPLEIAITSAFRERLLGGEREMTIPELLHYRKTGLHEVSADEINAELHGRLVRSLSLLFLPLIAIPLGIGHRRMPRAAGLSAGIVLLVIYHHLLQFGESLSNDGSVSPWLSLWGPMLAYTSLGLWMFYRSETVPGYSVLTAFGHTLSGLKDRILRLRQGARS